MTMPEESASGPVTSRVPVAALRRRPSRRRVRACRECDCTNDDACVIDGRACYWVEIDLCSACACPSPIAALAAEQLSNALRQESY